ncbi:MAG: hypothetical protein ABL904_22140 [Hyphomicrobiaceae bacterium]
MTKSRRTKTAGGSGNRTGLDDIFDASASAHSDCAGTVRISAPEAERLGLYPDWPTWPLGAALEADWEWLLQQVAAGCFPDLPCCWSEQISPGRAAIFWLDASARTRHLVVGYGHRVLTAQATSREPRQHLH